MVWGAVSSSPLQGPDGEGDSPEASGKVGPGSSSGLWNGTGAALCPSAELGEDAQESPGDDGASEIRPERGG